MVSSCRSMRRVANGGATYSLPSALTGGTIWCAESPAPPRNRYPEPPVNAMGWLLERIEPLMSPESCHWMNSPAFSVYVVTAFCGAAATFGPEGRDVVGTTFTVVLSTDATICPHAGPRVGCGSAAT